jgi:nitroimidazol reductase NimA-like FMN-containing flavoprotein (pyridoxamine 5'-phosphate oxidase superfamily)
MSTVEPARIEADVVHIEELDREECFRLLATQEVGRLAVAEPGQGPHVYPVNYKVLRASIVFRTDSGTKLRLLTTEPVSFQVDFVDQFHHCGWSVLLRGLAYQASNWEIEVEDIHVEPYAPGGKWQWVRVTPTTVTGRRIELPVPCPMDPRGYL